MPRRLAQSEGPRSGSVRMSISWSPLSASRNGRRHPDPGAWGQILQRNTRRHPSKRLEQPFGLSGGRDQGLETVGGQIPGVARQPLTPASSATRAGITRLRRVDSVSGRSAVGDVASGQLCTDSCGGRHSRLQDLTGRDHNHRLGQYSRWVRAGRLLLVVGRAAKTACRCAERRDRPRGH
jgi:hypothetical protein